MMPPFGGLLDALKLWSWLLADVRVLTICALSASREETASALVRVARLVVAVGRANVVVARRAMEAMGVKKRILACVVIELECSGFINVGVCRVY